jgi:hypothetical protein
MGKANLILAYSAVIGMVLLAGWTVCSPESAFRSPCDRQDEGLYRGEPASHWLDQLQARDPSFRQQAVQALQMIGLRDERAVETRIWPSALFIRHPIAASVTWRQIHSLLLEPILDAEARVVQGGFLCDL